MVPLKGDEVLVPCVRAVQPLRVLLRDEAVMVGMACSKSMTRALCKPDNAPNSLSMSSLEHRLYDQYQHDNIKFVRPLSHLKLMH